MGSVYSLKIGGKCLIICVEIALLQKAADGKITPIQVKRSREWKGKVVFIPNNKLYLSWKCCQHFRHFFQDNIVKMKYPSNTFSQWSTSPRSGKLIWVDPINVVTFTNPITSTLQVTRNKLLQLILRSGTSRPSRYVKLRFAGAPGMFSRKPLVNDPGMHHGTCVTHEPWCMSGSLTRSGGENVPGILGACATRNFTYLVRGPNYPTTQWVKATSKGETLIPESWCQLFRHWWHWLLSLW